MELEAMEQHLVRQEPISKRKRWIEVRDPQDHSLIETIPAADQRQMETVIEKAAEGARIAAALPVYERAAILGRAADLIQSRLESFAVTIAREGSKTIREARKEAGRCVETLRLSAEEARRIHGETIPFDQVAGNGDRVGYFTRFPVGLIGAITPFNDPLNLVAHKVGPAIAAGNAMVLKPASLTPLSALKLEAILEEAGLPKQVFQVVTGYGGEIGDVLVRHPAVRMLSFTGGTEAGEAITRKAGLKKISMELGSNSPVLVLRDADLDEAVASSVSGAFWAAGQNCLGVQRILIEDPVYEAFVERFVKRARSYRVGDKLSEETDMGPMITEKEAIRVERWVQEAVDRGAEVLCGGERNGCFFTPTVLIDVPPDCRIVCEEVFGPVVSLYRVDSLEGAIREANRYDYGLQVGVFTKDIEKAFEVIRRTEAGGVMINDSSDFRIDAMPFGGVKSSGLGREGVKYAIQEMTETKVVCFRLGLG
ncbi:aldehyde dehydrogenase family protein [Desmospora profundinema]|uniref:Glyceraldehyde-3-phosphate dehydrogenase (NADP+) n=1 Tax=Desmospora profundinema TaxID=1571184 RepID=A0ABU1IH47_9BACL|nr:aldehyde dehydrogenase family protein [Desmospora profundinema]MDR6224100.1 glyceraldehyde-3-phosphate dehydrogenase (NADP+) [Desmospora profundinema]